MKNFACIAMIFAYFFHPGIGGLAFGLEPETQPYVIIQKNKEYQPSAQDVEFAKRSDRASQWTFKKIPRELGLSMVESFWGWGGLAFGLGAGLSAAIYPFDEDILQNKEKDSWFGNTTNQIVDFGLSPYSYFGVSVLLWISGYASKHPKLQLTGKALTEAIFLSMAVTTIGKVAFRRTRPNGGNFSFPSGHATAAYATAGVLTVFYGWKGGVPSYALATLIGLSRIDSQDHWVSDVLMGAVVGSVIGVGTAMFHKKENQNFFITPQVSRDAASLNVHYIF